MVVSIILGSVSLVGAPRVQKYLGLETTRKTASGLVDHSRLEEFHEQSGFIEMSTLEDQSRKESRIGEFQKTPAEILAETCSPDVTLSEKVGDDSDGETLEL